MSNLTPYTNGDLLSASSALSRRSPAGRELARLQEQAVTRALRTDIEGRLADIKIGAAAALGTSAMQHVAAMTAMEGELVRAVPLAASRLEMIGNMTTIATTEIVTDAVAKLRRM